jgi:hypothetical protein
MKVLISSVFCIVPLLTFNTSAQEEFTAENAYVTLVESFGISTKKEGDKFRTITFIPRTFLLFKIDREEPDNKVGRDYLAATTQDGVRVFIKERVVSKGPFKTVFGEQDVIFNKQQKVCYESSCNQDDDDQLLQINAGEVFTMEERLVDSSIIYKLVGNRGNRNLVNEVIGYISKVELDELNQKSIVTYTGLKHPRYSVSSNESKKMNTTCGQKHIKGESKTLGPIDNTDKEIIDAFKLGSISLDKTVVNFSKSYGDNKKEVIYKSYDVIDNRQKTAIKTQYAAQLIYSCDEQGIFQTRNFIESVSFINSSTGEAQTFTPNGTPNDLHEKIGAPYLYSINNSRHYFALMDHLSTKFESRALAGYFLSGFNRSCRGTERKSIECQHKAYEK